MNKEIRQVINEFTPKTEAKDRIYQRLMQTETKVRSVKATRSFSKRAVAFAAAAAVLGTGAIGAGAYAAYNNGFFNGAKALYPNTELSDKDIGALKAELSDPRFSDEFWDTEIRAMLEMNKKAEQQALAKYGLDYVTDTYLPEKLTQMGIM